MWIKLITLRPAIEIAPSRSTDCHRCFSDRPTWICFLLPLVVVGILIFTTEQIPLSRSLK